MDELARNRIGTALRRMAEDLVAERRRVAVLEKENRELKAELDELRHAARLRDTRRSSVSGDDGSDGRMDAERRRTA